MPEKRSSDSEALVHRALADPSRVEILAALDAAREPPDAAQLARAVGLHVNTVRSHLRQLEAAGLVQARRDAQGKPGRPHLVFDLIGLREDDASKLEAPAALEAYRLLASVLASSVASDSGGTVERVDVEAAACSAVRALTREQPTDAGPIGRVARLLAKLGFDPLVRTPEAGAPQDAPTEIVMRACPYEALGAESLEVACSVHRGLIRGAFDSDPGADIVVVELDPQPGSCVARLAAAS